MDQTLISYIVVSTAGLVLLVLALIVSWSIYQDGQRYNRTLNEMLDKIARGEEITDEDMRKVLDRHG